MFHFSTRETTFTQLSPAYIYLRSKIHSSNIPRRVLQQKNTCSARRRGEGGRGDGKKQRKRANPWYYERQQHDAMTSNYIEYFSVAFNAVARKQRRVPRQDCVNFPNKSIPRDRSLALYTPGEFISSASKHFERFGSRSTPGLNIAATRREAEKKVKTQVETPRSTLMRHHSSHAFLTREERSFAEIFARWYTARLRLGNAKFHAAEFTRGSVSVATVGWILLKFSSTVLICNVNF